MMQVENTESSETFHAQIGNQLKQMHMPTRRQIFAQHLSIDLKVNSFQTCRHIPSNTLLAFGKHAQNILDKMSLLTGRGSQTIYKCLVVWNKFDQLRIEFRFSTEG